MNLKIVNERLYPNRQGFYNDENKINEDLKEITSLLKVNLKRTGLSRELHGLFFVLAIFFCLMASADVWFMIFIFCITYIILLCTIPKV